MKKEIITWIAIIVGLIGLLFVIVLADKNMNQDGADKIPTLSEDINEKDWVKVGTSSVISLVEYSDFQCPACYEYFFLIEKVLANYGDKIKFAYRHFPLTQHPNAWPASYYAEAGGKQGKFWEMYKTIFEKQKEWSNLDIKDAEKMFQKFGNDLGLDVNKLISDANSKEIKEKVENDLKTGRASKLLGTPTFYLNGKMVNLPFDEVSVNEFIEKAINDAITSDTKNN